MAITIERFTTLRGRNDRVRPDRVKDPKNLIYFDSESGEVPNNIYRAFLYSLQFGEIFGTDH